jgi:5-methylcytosine-specific restriction endonuclease McrA
MPGLIEQKIRQLAADRCEHCLFPQSESELPHVLDHIIARKHGGSASLENLALCCGKCNRYKGPNIAGIDPATMRLTRLFNPRSDVWSDRFEYQSSVLIGLTDVGRTTIQVLAINLPLRVVARRLALL